MAESQLRSDTKQRRALYIAVGSDCDPDRTRYGGPRYDQRDGLKWEGVREGVVKATGIARKAAEETSVPIRITWCVRSDNQMKQTYGDSAWPYREFAELWDGLAEAGDEIAWHAHVWRWDDAAGCWYQEIEDRDWMSDCLGGGYQALCEALGKRVATSRMGWEFHNDHTMQAVAALGIANDFSAIPGWFTPGEAGQGSKFHCCADWRETPAQPYRPSRADYRRPAANGEEELAIREFPMSTFTSAFWGGLRTLSKAVSRHGPRGALRALLPGTWMPAQIKAYATIKPAVFDRLIRQKLRAVHEAADGIGFLITAFHPDELLQDDPSKLYASAHFETNLHSIILHARKQHIEPIFVTIAELSAIHAQRG